MGSINSEVWNVKFSNSPPLYPSLPSICCYEPENQNILTPVGIAFLSLCCLCICFFVKNKNNSSELNRTSVRVITVRLCWLREDGFLQAQDSSQDGATSSLLSIFSPIAWQSSDHGSGQSCRGSTAWARTRTGYKRNNVQHYSSLSLLLFRCETWKYNTSENGLKDGDEYRAIISFLFLSASVTSGPFHVSPFQHSLDLCRSLFLIAFR